MSGGPSVHARGRPYQINILQVQQDLPGGRVESKAKERKNPRYAPPGSTGGGFWGSVDKTFYLCNFDKLEGIEMARVVIEGFPDDLYHELKIKAATERTSVKALLIAAAKKSLGRKAGKA